MFFIYIQQEECSPAWIWRSHNWGLTESQLGNQVYRMHLEILHPQKANYKSYNINNGLWDTVLVKFSWMSSSRVVC